MNDSYRLDKNYSGSVSIKTFITGNPDVPSGKGRAAHQLGKVKTDYPTTHRWAKGYNVPSGRATLTAGEVVSERDRVCAGHRLGALLGGVRLARVGCFLVTGFYAGDKVVYYVHGIYSVGRSVEV